MLDRILVCNTFQSHENEIHKKLNFHGFYFLLVKNFHKFKNQQNDVINNLTYILQMISNSNISNSVSCIKLKSKKEKTNIV